MSNSFYIELSFALLLGSILIPLFFTENFGVKDYTIIFFGIKYINYLAFLADLMTVIGILIAFRELYNRIEIENEFFSAIDQKMTVLDNIDLYDDIKKITNQHKQYIDTNAYEYRLLYEHYREKKKWLDFAIYYRELQGILKDISSEYNDLISDELIKAYIGKRQIKIKKRAIKMKVIKKWVKSEIKRTK